MNILKLQDRVQCWAAKLYTRLAAGCFASFGKDNTLFFSSRFDGAERISIGSNVFIRPRVWLNAVGEWGGRACEGRIDIHDSVCIMDNVQISANRHIVLEEGSSIGRNCTVIDHNHDFTHLDMPIVMAPPTEGRQVVIGRNTMVAVGCLIGPGVTIGEHCFVGANSVVTRSVPPFCFVSGNPAEIRRQYNPESGRWEAPPREEA